jgi:hypothetical protein
MRPGLSRSQQREFWSAVRAGLSWRQAAAAVGISFDQGEVLLAALESRWTALPNRARSVVGEHPGDLNDTGTDAGSVLNAELAGSAPPPADGIVR